MKRRRRFRKDDTRCQLSIVDVAAVNSLTAYFVSNSSTFIRCEKIIRRKVRNKIKREAKYERFRYPLAKCRHLARHVLSTQVWRAWICRRERGRRGGHPTLSPVAAPPCTVHVIIRCRRGPTNILITSQYINYWPYNLAGTRRGISPRNVQTRSNVLRPSTSSIRSAFAVLRHDLVSLPCSFYFFFLFI